MQGCRRRWSSKQGLKDIEVFATSNHQADVEFPDLGVKKLSNTVNFTVGPLFSMKAEEHDSYL